MLAENTNAARRRELSMAYLTRGAPDRVNSDNISFSIAVIGEITKKFGTQHAPYTEGHFPDLAQNPIWSLSDALRGLLFRGRLQSNVFQVFLQLVNENVCNISSLAFPVGYNHQPPVVRWIVRDVGLSTKISTLAVNLFSRSRTQLSAGFPFPSISNSSRR